MKSKGQMRWALLACIWLTAIGLTGWNIIKIGELSVSRRATEGLRREIHFQRHNAPRLGQLVAQHEALFMGIESLDLGVVALRDRLRALAAAFHLEDLSIEADMGQAMEGQIPCRLTATGAFESAVSFLTALDQYTYLSARQCQVGAVPGAQTVRLEMSFFVQYKIVPPEAPAVPLPKVTQQPLPAEGQPL